MTSDLQFIAPGSLAFDARTFPNVLEMLPDAVVIVDADGRIVGLNQQTQRLFQYRRDELLGQAVEILLPERFHNIHQAHRTAYITDPRTRPMGLGLELAGQRRDGSEFPVEISLSPFSTGTQELVIAVIRDVTERKQAEERAQDLIREQAARAEAEAAGKRLDFLAKASEILFSSLDDQTTLTSITRLVVPALADLCVVDILDDPSIRPIAVAHVDPRGEQLLRDMRQRYPLDLTTNAPVAEVMRIGKPMLFPDVPIEFQASISRDDAQLDMLRKLAYKSVMVVPLNARGRTLGTIMIVSTSPERRYGLEDLTLATELAGRAATAIDNARLYTAEQQARLATERTAGRIARLQEMTAAIAGALTPPQIAEIVVGQGVDALGAAAGSLLLLNEDGTALEMVAATGYPMRVLESWLQIPVDTPVQATEAVRARRPIWITSWEEAAARYPILEHVATTGAQSFAAVPLVVEDRAIGVIGLSFRKPREFDADDRSFMVTLANQCALAIERARLYDAERDARHEAESIASQLIRLQEVTAAIAGAVTPAEIAEIAVGQGVEALHAVAGLILLIDPAGQMLETIASTGYEDDVRASWQSIPLDLPVPVTEAVHTRNPVWIASWEDAVARYPILGSARTTGGQSFAALPFVVEERVIGAMGLSFSGPRSFNADERSFMMTLANQCAIAIERARLYDAERQSRAEAEASARIREEFLSIASHELKTPLTSIKAAAQLVDRRLMVSNVQDERIQKLVGQLRSEVTRLETLVSDLLDVSRIQRGRLELRPERFDLVELAHEVAGRFEGAAEWSDGHVIEVRAGGSVEGTWDRSRIDQVLSNLLSNALKYSPDGGTIQIHLEGDDNSVHLRISDQGMGMSPDERSKLFQPFARGEQARLLTGGTGLGLYITATIVAQHGGSIEAESDLDQGSTFTVRLPRDVSDIGSE